MIDRPHAVRPSNSRNRNGSYRVRTADSCLVMPPTRRVRSAVPEVVGSHQSEADVAAMMPEQHQVLADGAAVIAAATSNKPSGNARAGVSSNTIGKSKKKLFKDVRSANEASSQSSPSRRRNGPKNDKAILKFVRAIFQKGTKANTFSGAVYMNGKPRYGNNETFKRNVNAKAKGQFVRFNGETKLYSVKVANVKTAISVREAMKTVSAEDEKDLNESAPTDEDIRAIFDFEEAHSNVINIIGSIDLNGTDNVGIKGATFDFKDEFNALDAWSWDPHSKFWLAPLGTNTDELEAIFEEYGFDVEHYDGIAGHGDSDEDEEM